ncbi:MAG: sulfite exporter TauE/SafE family protein [bacterium]|jgi:uncharacterized membrane protein YfcA
MTWIAAYLFFGAVVGLLAGLLGLGGGMTLVPILSALFAAQSMAPGYIVHLALGTGMASMVFTSFASVREHHRLGSVDWSVVRRLVPGILLGSFAASAASGWFSQHVLAVAYGVIAIVGAAQLLRSSRPQAARALPGIGWLTFWMFGIGVICGLMSAGGAFLTVPFMVYCGVAVRAAIGTGAALGWPVAVFGTIGYVISGWSVPGLPPGSLGFVYLPALAALVASSMVFAPIGARLMHRLPVLLLRRMFAVLLIGLALKMVYSYGLG